MYVQKNNKSHLLIAIGDSWTQGVGNYDPVYVADMKPNDMIPPEIYRLNVPLFGPGSYAAKLAELLDFDLINTGHGGRSNAGCVKEFITNHDLNYLETYKSVTVIFLMTEWFRVGLFSEGRIKDFKINNFADTEGTFAYHYLKHVYSGDNDGMLEAKFVLKALESFCKVRSYNFFYGQAFTNISKFNEIYNTSSNLHNYITETSFSECLNSDEYAWCGHPNSEGHKTIAKRIYNIISNNNLLKDIK
jgi:hypothetical protein